MTLSTSLPILGASFHWNDIEANLEWLVEGRRPLELPVFHDPNLLDGDWRSYVKGFKPLLRQLTGPLSIHAPGGVRISTNDPAERAFIQNRFRIAIAAAAEIGASHMVIEPWFFSFSNATVRPGYMDRKIDFAEATLRPLLTEAEQAGVTMVMENVPEVWVDLIPALCDRLASPAIRCCIDVGHAYLMHRQHGAPTLTNWIEAAGERLVHIHLTDNDGEADRHWAPGEGHILWFEVFEAFRALPAFPRLILEIAPDRARRGAHYFEGLGYAR